MAENSILNKVVDLTEELQVESSWTEEQLTAYFNSVFLEKVLRTRQYINFMKAETIKADTKEEEIEKDKAREEAKKISRELKITFLANKEKFTELTEKAGLFVVVEHLKYSKERWRRL